MRCRCDGRYDGCEHQGRCPESGPGRWSPYFCGPCDARRMGHIGENLREIAAEMREESNHG